MNAEVLKIIYSITSFQLFFFAWIVLFMRPVRNFQYWLAAFLFIKFLILSITLSYHQFQWLNYNKIIWIIETFTAYILCPVFYLFVIKASHHQIKSHFKLLPALIPFIVAYTINFLPKANWDSNWKFLLQLLYINYYVQAIIYFILSFKLYKSFQQNLGNYLNQELLKRSRWLKLVIFGFILLWGMSGIIETVNLYIPGDRLVLDAGIEILFLVSINVLIFLGVRQPQVMHEAIRETHNKYAFSNLAESEKDIILEQLSTVMAKKKLYKAPFSVNDGTTVKAIVYDGEKTLLNMKEIFGKGQGLFWIEK